MPGLLNITEIAILIILPLILFYLRSSWKLRYYAPSIVALYLIWYITYALMHELCHMIGIWIAGKEILDYQLIPHFWKGDFKTGYVNYDFNAEKKDILIIILPYLRDLIFISIGYLIIRKYRLKHSFTAGLVLIIFILSPLYDIINNYSAFVFGALNDFNAINLITNRLISNSLGIIMSFSAIFVTVKILILLKGYPKITT